MHKFQRDRWFLEGRNNVHLGTKGVGCEFSEGHMSWCERYSRIIREKISELLVDKKFMTIFAVDLPYQAQKVLSF